MIKNLKSVPSFLIRIPNHSCSHSDFIGNKVITFEEVLPLFLPIHHIYNKVEKSLTLGGRELMRLHHLQK